MPSRTAGCRPPPHRRRRHPGARAPRAPATRRSHGRARHRAPRRRSRGTPRSPPARRPPCPSIASSFLTLVSGRCKNAGPMPDRPCMVAATRRETPKEERMNQNSSEPVFETALTGLTLLHRGKVRDIYALDADLMLIVTTDRLSAFDVVLPDPIPAKGRVLTQISNFWFERTSHLVANQLADIPVEHFVTDAAERRLLKDRAIVVKRLRALPVEAVVR